MLARDKFRQWTILAFDRSPIIECYYDPPGFPLALQPPTLKFNVPTLFVEKLVLSSQNHQKPLISASGTPKRKVLSSSTMHLNPQIVAEQIQVEAAKTRIKNLKFCTDSTNSSPVRFLLAIASIASIDTRA